MYSGIFGTAITTPMARFDCAFSWAELYLPQASGDVLTRRRFSRAERRGVGHSRTAPVKPFVVRFFVFKAHARYRDIAAVDQRLHCPQHRYAVFFLNVGNAVDSLAKLRGWVEIGGFLQKDRKQLCRHTTKSSAHTSLFPVSEASKCCPTELVKDRVGLLVEPLNRGQPWAECRQLRETIVSGKPMKSQQPPLGIFEMGAGKTFGTVTSVGCKVPTISWHCFV